VDDTVAFLIGTYLDQQRQTAETNDQELPEICRDRVDTRRGLIQQQGSRKQPAVAQLLSHAPEIAPPPILESRQSDKIQISMQRQQPFARFEPPQKRMFSGPLGPMQRETLR
jgi:hypothetical protein